MPTFDMFVIIGFVLVLALLGVLYLLPTDKETKTRKKSSGGAEPETQQQKDWQAVSLKLEKHINEIRGQLTDTEKKARLFEKELEIQKQKVKHLQEKIEQERSWKKKEEEDVDRRNKEVGKLKDDLKKNEDTLHTEHSERLRLEREAKDLREGLAAANEKTRLLELDLAKAKNQSDMYRDEVKNLKAENAKLAQKKEEASFVAKSDYDQVAALLKEREKEIERLRHKT